MSGEPVWFYPTKEKLADGKERDSWPAPWLTGDYRHRLWQRFTVSADPDEKRQGADNFREETYQRYALALTLLVGKETKGPETIKKVDMLGAYLDRLADRYNMVFNQSTQLVLTDEAPQKTGKIKRQWADPESKGWIDETG